VRQRATAPMVLLSVLIGMAAAAAAAAAAAPPALGDDEGARLAALLREVAPAIVTVKVVSNTTVQMGGKSADHESRVELPGVVVGTGGLIMTSIVPFAPDRLMKLLAPGGAATRPQLKAVPSEIEVVFEQDEKERRAFLAATDSNLGVAFLQIEEPGGQKLKAVDFSQAGGGALGDLVAVVSRLGKEYDSTAYFETARLSGEITKPRRVWILDRSLSSLGLPVFSPAGKVLGILGIVESGLADADSSADRSLSMAMQALAGGGMVRFFVVPAPAVAAVIDQARQQAAQKAADRAAKKAAPSPPAQP
jgi:hypothetical protein